jgi:hypothetical protein
MSTGQAEALKRLRESKKDLARVNTLLRAHELAATPQTVKAPKAAAAPRVSKKAGKA